MAEQTGHTIIDTHYVLGIFGTDTWTNGARACDLLCFFAFYCFWSAVGDDDTTETDGVLGICWYLFFGFDLLEFEFAAFLLCLSCF
jgi:hypothetical protein